MMPTPYQARASVVSSGTMPKKLQISYVSVWTLSGIDCDGRSSFAAHFRKGGFKSTVTGCTAATMEVALAPSSAERRLL